MISLLAGGAAVAETATRDDSYSRSEVVAEAEKFCGKGTLVRKSGGSTPVWWQGPSIGFDIGGNAAKCFTLVYNLRDTRQLFQRYPGVEGSLYFVGGFSLNYNRTDDVTLAPVRFGVGWRQGASVGYLHFTPKMSLLPI